jgi:carbon storage regulator
MLSLTRRPNESITLYTSDGIVEILVSQIKGNQARIGIEAPKSINIVRSEIANTSSMLIESDLFSKRATKKGIMKNFQFLKQRYLQVVSR